MERYVDRTRCKKRPTEGARQEPRGSDLVGADDEHDAVHVGLGAHFLFHLPQPAVEGVETLPQADVVNQQHPLTVLVELITHLTGRKEGGQEEKQVEAGFLIFSPGATAPPAGRPPS